MSSSVTFASTAIILSSDVFKTGLISNIEASHPTYAAYNEPTNFAIALKAAPESPKLKAIFLAWNPCKPNAGSTISL